MAQTNTVYDPDADNEYEHFGDQFGVPHEEAAQTEQRALDGAVEDSKANDTGFFNEHGDTKASPSNTSGASEQTNNEPSSNGTSGESLYEDGSGTQTKRSRVRGTLKSLSNHKLLVGGIAAGGALPIILIILLVLLISPYKVVAFAENMTTYQFARNTRQMTQNVSEITSEDIGIQAADDGLWGSMKSYYTTKTSELSDLWSKLDKYRPNKIISNFQNSGKLKFNYKTSKVLGRQQLESVTIDNTTSAITRGSVKNLIPGYNFVSGAQFSKDFAPDFIDSLKLADYGPIVRSQLAKNIRQEADVSLTSWVVGRFLAKVKPNATPAEQAAAETQQERVAEEQLAFDFGGSNNAVAQIGNSGVDSLAQQAKTAENNDVSNNTTAAAITNNPNQLSLDLESTLNAGATAAAASGADAAIHAILKFINPIYGVAVPVCLIYDGSMQKAGSSIDEQTLQNERTGLLVAVEASQEKDGSNVNPEAVGATDWKLGDISQSNAQIRSSGLPINTSTYSSTESSAYGQYTYSLADFLPGPISSAVSVIGGTCPLITNLWVGVGLGAANLVVSALTGGGAAAGDAATKAAASAAVDETVPTLTQTIITKLLSGGSFLKDFGIDVGKKVALYGSLTLLAKYLVATQIGATHNTLATGPSYDNDADSGMNVYANQVNQQEFYGAPLTDSELQQDNSRNAAALAYSTSRENAYQRYLAIDNPSSLLNHMGIALSDDFNGSIFSSLATIGSSVMNPIHALGSLFGTLFSHTVYAAVPVTSVNTYYGNIQFGYSAAEQQLMETSSYHPLENQLILSQSNQEAGIASTYGKCFDGSVTIGTMLQDGYIQRYQNGDIVPNQGLCSPDNLGPNNQDPNSPCGSHGCGDLVFRWRVAESYSNTLDQLIGEQDVTASPATTPQPQTQALKLNTASASDVAQQASTNGVRVGYAVYDSTGNELANYDENFENYGAAITKPMLLIAYLKQLGSDSLTTAVQSKLTGMMNQSNDADANTIYKLLKNPQQQLNELAAEVGMQGFKLDTSDPQYVLGQSQITANDMAKLFSKIDTLIPDNQKTFALQLLTNTTPTVGLLQAGLPGTIYSKEGWRAEPASTNPFGNEGSPYVVNQTAQFSYGGSSYGIAVTVSGTKDESSGESIIQNIAQSLISAGQ